MLDTHVNLGDTAPALAAWATTAEAFPSLARARAQQAFIDVIGCMVAGSRDPATTAVRTACAAWGNGHATVVGAHENGTPMGQAAPWAALINGTSAHALDFDDNFDPAKAHISAVLAPALLALAETGDQSGCEVIDAYIVGTEIAARIGTILNPGHRDAGWHATGTIGAIAATGACARLLRLDRTAFAHALNTATSFASGTMAQFGTMAKAVHAGSAAAAGIMAARFAACGLEAGNGAIDGRYGLAAMMHGDRTNMPSIGQELALIRHGLKTKLYPCCASAHRAIDAIIALSADHDLRAANIAHITVHAPESHLANLMYDAPVTSREARFSLPFCAALARRRVTLADFTPAALNDPVLRDVMTRVAAVPIRLPESRAPTRVDIAMADGTCVSATVVAPRGHIDNPLSDDERWGKFTLCCADILNPQRCDDLAAALKDFDSDIPASAIMRPLRP